MADGQPPRRGGGFDPGALRNRLKDAGQWVGDAFRGGLSDRTGHRSDDDREDSGPANRPPERRRLRVGDWLVRPNVGLLERDGRETPLPDQQMRLLVILASRPGKAIPRDELLEELWPDTIVAESGLTRCVSELRAALEDDPKNPRYIQTLPKRGYRLIAPVEADGEDPPSPVTGRFGRRAAFLLLALALCVTALWFWRRAGLSDSRGSATPGGVFDAAANPEAHDLLLDGSESLRRFDLVRARQLLRRSVEEEPRHALARRALAEALLLSGNAAAAREEAGRALELAGDLPRPFQVWISAWAAAAELRWEEAAREFQALIVLEPENRAAAFGLALSRLNRGDYAGVLALGDRFDAASDESHVRLRLIVIEAAIETDKIERALETSTLALAAAERLDSPGLAIRARALHGRALLGQGETEEGLAELDSARRLAAEVGDLTAQAEVLRELGDHALRLGRFPDGEEAYSGALALARSTENMRLEAAALGGLARCAQAADRSDRAAEYFEMSKALVESLGDRRQLAVLLGDMAIFSIVSLRDLARGQRQFEGALEIFRSQGDEGDVASTLLNLGTLTATRGQVSVASGYFAEAVGIYRRSGNRERMAQARHNEGLLLFLRGRMDAATEALREALGTFRETGNERMEAASLTRLGLVEAARGRLETARRLMEEGLAIRARQGSSARVTDSRLSLADLALLEGDPRRAEIEARSLEDTLDETGVKWEEARRIRVTALLDQQRAAEALALLADTPPSDEEEATCCAWRLLEIEGLLLAGETEAAERMVQPLRERTDETGQWAEWAEAELLLARIELRKDLAARALDRLLTLEDKARELGWVDLAERANGFRASGRAWLARRG